MSFLFGRKPSVLSQSSHKVKAISNLKGTTNINYFIKLFKEKDSKFSQTTDLSDFDLGSHQPNNPFKDLTLLPYFSSIVRQICVLSDEKR